MLHSLPNFALSALSLSVFLHTTATAIDPELTGTWSTKSNAVITGPGFYDPVKERFIEPKLTGISYSFTDDGFYEEAYYRAVPNPVNPQCPQGIMQFQHGTFVKNADNSLTLTPFGTDGRQLLSTPCKYKNSVYTRWNMTENFKSYRVYTDPYHNILRLDLAKFDGSPMNPMFLAYRPPQMLPTSTLNPIATPTHKGTKATGKVKRNSREPELPLTENPLDKRRDPVDADKLWWIGVGVTAIGAVGYLCF